MANRLAFGKLIRELRAFIAEHDGEYTQLLLWHAVQRCGYRIGRNTIGNAEQDEGLQDRNFEALAATLSQELRRVHVRHPKSEWFNPLKLPQLGWVLDRLERGIDPVLQADDLIMNHDERYFVDLYKVNLAVWPCVGAVAAIDRSGRPEPEQFPHNDMAVVKYKLVFSDRNERLEPGFKLSYGTHDGRVEVVKPREESLIDDKGYRLHKTSAGYLPDPRDARAHEFELKVFGGYGPGGEMAHFTLAQPAVYQNVSFGLDLTGYPDEAFVKQPELILVPVLTDRKYDCCDIARKGRGLIVPPDEQHGLAFKWRFRGLVNVMICVRWETNPQCLSSFSPSMSASLGRLISKLAAK